MLVLFLSTTQVECGFSNHGIWRSENINLVVNGTLENEGELIGSNSATLCCETLSGSGLIQAPQIIIKTKAFAYTGKIDCSGKCLVIASHIFDEHMFERSGDGEFVILYDTMESVINLNAEFAPKPTGRETMFDPQLPFHEQLFIEDNLN